MASIIIKKPCAVYIANAALSIKKNPRRIDGGFDFAEEKLFLALFTDLVADGAAGFARALA